MRKKTLREIISQFCSIHGDKYDYSKVEYNGALTKVRIICREHGEFWQTPSSHLSGCGCPECGNNKTAKKLLLSTDDFIRKAIIKHGNSYIYHKSKYSGAYKPIFITCPKHGDFYQTPHNHLLGNGCPKCSIENNTTSKLSTNEDFIIKAKEKHSNKYDYSKVEYKNYKTKLCIICPRHGEFWQLPTKHLDGHGCPKCNGGVSITKEEFINKANKIHHNEYIYSKVNYINTKTKVCIICPKHGEFWQTPTNHIHKTKPHGCPMCKSSRMEKSIREILSDNNIDFEEQKRFEWLGKQSLDFYLPKQNIAIECQGRQHFEEVDFFGGKQALIENKNRDNKKYILCKKYGLKIFYFISKEHKNNMKNGMLYITSPKQLLDYITL